MTTRLEAARLRPRSAGEDLLRIAHVGPVATAIPPGKSGSVEQMTSLLTEGLVARGHEVTLFATGDSQTRARLHAIYQRGYWHDETMWPWELCEMFNLAAAVERAKAGRQSPLVADVTISAPPAYATARLAQPLADLRRQHPGIRVRVIGETRQASLNRREADIAVRLSRPTVGDLTCVKIGESQFRLYASISYLEATPIDAWQFVAYDEALDAAPQQARLLSLLKGRTIGLRASTLEMQMAFLLAHGGVGMLPDFMADGQDGLIVADPDEPPLTREVWMAVHTDMKDAPPIRAVMDGVAQN